MTRLTQSEAKYLPGSAIITKSSPKIYFASFIVSSTEAPIYSNDILGRFSCPFKCNKAFGVINPPPISITLGLNP